MHINKLFHIRKRFNIWPKSSKFGRDVKWFSDSDVGDTLTLNSRHSPTNIDVTLDSLHEFLKSRKKWR